MKRNKINSESGACQAKTSKQAGSTIIAVLAAMLFIGVVTASMVKNTGSQSAASIGYSTLQTMSSTARSGMVATETYFAKQENTAILEKMDARLNGDANKTFIFRNDKKKVPIGNTQQFFNSELAEVIPPPSIDGLTFFVFKLKSGRGESGRDLKSAMGFYSNKDDLLITNTSTFGAKNALSSEGTVRNGDAGVDVRDGPATFMKDVKFQNDAPAVFGKDVYFGGKAEFNTNVKFNDRVYFHDDVTMQNVTTSEIFNSSVGFNNNINVPGFSSSSPHNFDVGGNVWINGTLGEGPFTDGSESAKSIKFTNIGDAGNTFNYTHNFLMEKTVMGCNDVPRTCSHTSHPIKGAQFVGYTSMDTYHPSQIDIADKMNMGNLEPVGTPGSRMDPELDMDAATDPSKGGTDKTYSLGDIMGNQTTVSANILNDAYAKAKSDNHLTADGYMVVKLGSDSKDTWYSWPNTPSAATFNEKVIFILEGSYQWSGSYFPTTTESSTLICVKENAVLNELNLKGEFNGLIYTDKNNTPMGGQNIIKADPVNGKIVGAIHNHSDGNLQWNTTASGVPPVIQFSEAALNKFARMSKGGAAGEWTTQYSEQDPSKRRIRLKPMGYYFY